MTAHKIEWLNVKGRKGETWNPITGCTPVGEGCRHCYARTMAETRLRGRCGYPQDDPFRPGTFHKDQIDKPMRWRKPRLVFVSSMGDFFHERAEVGHGLVFRVIEQTPQHHYVFLTKRPDVAADLLHELGHDMPRNATIGVSVWDQASADRLIPQLLDIPAAHHMVSVEPMLGSIRVVIPHHLDSGEPAIDWIVAGCETGPGARPAKLDWFRSLRDQCAGYCVPFLLKKTATEKRGYIDDTGDYVRCPSRHVRHLDGVLHDDYPGYLEVAP